MKQRFKKMYIEITNICNLSCDFCPKNSRKPKFMTIDEFDNVTDKLIGYGKFIYFHVMGEPLLHPDLGEFLSIAFKKGFKVNITTNGILIKEKSDVLLKSNALRQINFSLHSFDANVIDISFEEYLGDIVDFTAKALVKGDIYVALRLWNNEDSGIKKSNDRILSFLEKSFNLEYSIKNELTNKSSIKLKENLYLNMANKFDWPDEKGEEKEGKAFCYGLRDQIGVLTDGTVIPCCLDSEGTISLGNLLEQSMDDILKSDRVQRIYNSFSEGRAIEKLCHKCGYRTRFN